MKQVSWEPLLSTSPRLRGERVFHLNGRILFATFTFAGQSPADAWPVYIPLGQGHARMCEFWQLLYMAGGFLANTEGQATI